MKTPLSKTFPFCFRLTEEERRQLQADAGTMPVGAYVRSRVFDKTFSRKRSRSKRPVKDQKALGQVLAALGVSRIANNLNQIAKALNTGSFTPDMEVLLKEACHAILWMRDALMQALGLQKEDGK